MEEKPRSRFAGLVNIIMMLAISAGMVFGAQILGCNSTGHVTETKNKTKENFTENCYSYIMYVAKKGRYHDANVALCLCQESGDNIANQNKCSRGIDLQNFKEAVDSCSTLTAKKKIKVDDQEVEFQSPWDFKKCLEKSPGWKS